MKITYINTGNSVGNQTDYVAPIVIPIAAGLKQELLFEEMSAITNMQIGVYRNGTIVHQQQLAPSSTMRIDLSTFAQVLPSLDELYKNLAGDPTGNVQDMIRFVLLDREAVRSYSFYVCSLNCPYLNSRGWVHHDERNLVSDALASMVDPSTTKLVEGAGEREPVTSELFGTGTKFRGNGSASWVGDLPRSGALVQKGTIITLSIYVENVGTNSFFLVRSFNMSSSPDASNIRIDAGFKGFVSMSAKMEATPSGIPDSPYMWISAPNGPIEANFYCFMVNYGSEPKPWIKAGANAASPCVGALTDYRSGKLFDTRQVMSSALTTADLDLTGVRMYSRRYYSVGADPELKEDFFSSPSGSASHGASRSGDRLSEKTYSRLVNPDGTVYGWMAYENKMPKDVSPNCGVLLRWLNSRGWYDNMFFEKYSIKPVMRTNNSGGNGIDYYETTVQIDVNWDNEPCLNWIQRSSDIIARIPIDVCQFGRAALLATNVFQTQGGNKTKTIQFKFKVQIVEP